MKLFFLTLLSFALIIVESAVSQSFGLISARVDVAAAAVVFVALTAGTLEGAVCAYALGYLYDLMSGRPTGLYTFLAVLMFVILRLVASLVDVRGAVRFALVVMGAELGHAVLAAFFTWMTGDEGKVFGVILAGIFWRVALTGLGAVALYPLFRKFEPGSERSTFGELR